MRGLIALVLALALVWAGWWAIGSRLALKGAESWFETRTALGQIATRDSLSVQGFPSRFDLTLTGVHLADPATGVSWDLPILQILSLSYKPWHLIAALPREFRLTRPEQQVTITSADLKASIVGRPQMTLPLERLVLAGRGMALGSDLGWQLRAEEAQLASRRVEGSDTAHDIELDASGLTAGAASNDGARLKLVTRAEFDAPLDRQTPEFPGILSLQIRPSTLDWGTMGLSAEGALVADAHGYAEGRVELGLRNWRGLLGRAEEAGLIPGDLARLVEQGIAFVALQSADPDTVTVPLSFGNGRISLGPLPLGPAPLLR